MAFYSFTNHRSALISFHISFLHTFTRSAFGDAARSHRICFCSPTSQPTNERTYIAFVFWPRISERSLASNIILPHVDRPNPSRDTRSLNLAHLNLFTEGENRKQTLPALPTNHHNTPDSPSTHRAQAPQLAIETISASYSRPIKRRLVSALLGAVKAVLVPPRNSRSAPFYHQTAGVARACMRNISYHPDLSA